MSGPSSTSHLYRLGIVLVAFFVAAVLVGWWAVPSSWNFDVDHWYRKDALIDNAQKPMVYGGNESCKDCHEPAMKKLAKFKHRALSCESCHGPVADHVRGNKKFAAAKVDKSRWQCENCHQEQINRPKDFPQFSKTGDIGKFVKKHNLLEKKTLCLECHNAHDPTN
ncbi:MAG: cytochrome c3 family protein [Proteobacteria bacterium]|nr:cytochrome c3 family protein [Pseudomonadota bacterium]